MSVLQLIGIRGNTIKPEIARRGAGHDRRFADFARDQRRVVQRTASDRAVDIAADKVRGAVGNRQVDTNIRIGCHKISQQRDQHVASGGAAYRDAQMPFWFIAGSAK